MTRAYVALILVLCMPLPGVVLAQQGGTCGAERSCTIGCCSKDGKCGFGSDFCGDGCQSGCDSQPECGNGAPEGKADCPAGACCSPQGFCGIGSEFCSNCQKDGGCSVEPKKCDLSTDGAANLPVRIGYYDAIAALRVCNAIQPENLPAGVLTHINVGYEGISDSGEITDQNGWTMARVTRLKRRYDGLRVNVVIGGWDFNDPRQQPRTAETMGRWSAMVESVENRDKFVSSLVNYMHKYSLNGVDIDWRYPTDWERGGTEADYDNFVNFVGSVRDAFDAADGGWQVTVSVPYDYKYLQGYSLSYLERQVDWFNVHAYDKYDMWEKDAAGNGYIRPFSNTTLITETLDLFARNDIDPDKIVLGLGFHGEAYTVNDTDCTGPGCKFGGPGFPGDCTNEDGILFYSEVTGLIPQLGTETFYDEPSSSRWMVSSLSQFISYEDAQSFAGKVNLIMTRCLKGFAVMSLDYDSQDNQALTALVGEAAMIRSLVTHRLNGEERKRLVDDFAAYTGQNCYVTEMCASGGGDDPPLGKCDPGYMAVETGHFPKQIHEGFTSVECAEGSWHAICCPKSHMPKNCEWRGTPERSSFGCNAGCGDSQYELTTDKYLDPEGKGECYSGERSLCCDKTEVLDRGCYWTDCQRAPFDKPNACNDGDVGVATRLDQDNGDKCPTIRETDQNGRPFITTQNRWYCCPKSAGMESCKWSNDPSRFGMDPKDVAIGICGKRDCPGDELVETTAQQSEPYYQRTDPYSGNNQSCDGIPATPNVHNPGFKLCCEPPSVYTKEWPVLPSYLWVDASDDPEKSDVTWQWADDFGNNNHDITPDNLDENPGADPYGFVMIDGPPGSIDNAFGDSFTVVTENETDSQTVKRRSLITTDKAVLESVWDHSEETIRVYCNYPVDSPQCRRVFYKGAKDTIIKLPNHIGEGPWARIVSMKPEVDLAHEDLPGWVRKKRALEDNRNGIYIVKFDYNFHLIERQTIGDEEPVKIRIDFSNLEGYWDEVTNGTNSKRDVDHQVSFEQWRARVDAAKKRSLDSQQSHTASGTTDLAIKEKRWRGKFVDWLKKLTTLESKQVGVLPMTFAKFFNLFSGRIFCRSDTGITFTAGLDITADMQLVMDTRYSYYFSGTIVPPKINDMYAFARTQPKALAGITLAGDAQLAYATQPKRLINTLTYPGLAIKGIAAVGPSLDIWGQLSGAVTVSGQMRVGVTYTFKPIEMYLPNNNETHDRAEADLEDNQVDQEGLSPTFEASVQARVDFNVTVSPELNMGIQVGGRIGPFDGLLVDAHVSAFANTTLNFNARASAQTVNNNYNWEYNYEIALWYRIGIAAIAQIKFYGEWRSRTYYPVDWQKIKLFGPDEPIRSGVTSPQNVTKRGEDHISSWLSSTSPLSGTIFDAPPEWEPTNMYEHVGAIERSLGLSADSNDTSLSDPLLIRQENNKAQNDSKTNMEFRIGNNKFTCNAAPAICGGSNIDQTGNLKRWMPPHIGSLVAISPWRNPLSSLGTHGGGHGSSSLSRRASAVDDCAVLPRLYYNCVSAFMDFSFGVPTSEGGTGETVEMPGICRTLEAMMRHYIQVNNQRGSYSASQPMCHVNSCRLTFDHDERAQNRRRNQACKVKRRSRCTDPNKALERKLWGPGGEGKGPNQGLVSCDEFPFASSEEGGNTYDDPEDADIVSLYGTKTECVPTWQQTLQGNCNGLLRSLETNIRYFNERKSREELNANTDLEQAVWKKWDDPGWAQASAWPDPNDNSKQMQRKTRYSELLPRPAGVPKPEWQQAQKIGWFHRRNYTVTLGTASGTDANGNPSVDFTGAGGWTASFKGDLSIPTPADVLCAVNTMGQSRFRFAGRENGWCRTGQTRAYDGYEWQGAAERPTYKKCVVSFSPNTIGRLAPGKRDQVPIGEFGGHPIYGIEILPDAEEHFLW